MASSKAHIAAVKRYNKTHYKDITMIFKPDEFERLKSYCESTGESITGFVTAAIVAALDAAEKNGKGGGCNGE